MRTSIHKLSAVCVAETLSSGPGIVDVWYFHYEASQCAEFLAANLDLLSAAECERLRSFRFERDRRLFLATRVLVRSVLSNYSSVAPADWCFATGEHGKPHIASPHVAPRLHFNLSNTHGLVVCAVSSAHDSLGVDTEQIDRMADIQALADSSFSPAEIRELRSLPAAQQSQRFFDYWTLKESYIKARGLGLSLPLDKFSFSVVDNAAVGVCFDDSLNDESSRWRFVLLDALPGHLIAVGVDTDGAPLSLRAARFVPAANADRP